jgi:hypothetical protein
MTADYLPSYANAHIAIAIVNMPGFAGLLPGGIHRNVGPPGIAYPFAVMAHAGGGNALAMNTGESLVGGGLLYQIKVLVKGHDETPAVNAYVAMADALKAANNSTASGAVVAGQEESPLDLPVTENDQLYQQIGGNWRFWVDPV